MISRHGNQYAILLLLVSACAKVGATRNDGAADRGSGGDADAALGPDSNAGGSGGNADAAPRPDSNAGVQACEAAKAEKSAYGCEFYSVIPGVYDKGSSCFAAMLSNTWTASVSIQVTYDGVPLDVASLARTPRRSGQTLSYEPLVGNQLAPGQVAVLFLSDWGGDVFYVGCPRGVQPGVSVDPAVRGTGIGKAFRITTSGPVIAYDIYPYGGAGSYLSSATLLIPTPAWGRNYMAVDAYPWDSTLGLADGPFVQIVAAEDATKVTINPTVAIKGGGIVAPSPASQPQTYTLSKGQVLQFAQREELGGSPIASDKPIGVWGGSSCMRIPLGIEACDIAHQQMLPVTWLGSQYVAVRHRDRLPGHAESAPWTIVGTVDGTDLSYNPAPPPGAPASINRGQVVRFSASEPFVVRSKDDMHPFYVAGHMTGACVLGCPQGGDETSREKGDPEFVNAVPPQQWLRSYTFLTDPTYKNTHLVFIRQKGRDNSFKDVTLDCVGPLKGWAPVGTATQFEFTRVDFDKQPGGGCMDGAHSAHSAEPFGLTVWGWDTAVSYAYPAGLSTKPINDVIIVP